MTTTINTTGLLERQVPHVQTLVDSLHLNGYAIDLSDTGTGKTYASCGIAREMAVPFFIICPKIVIPSWTGVLKEFNIRAVDIKNYEALIRGGKNSIYTEWVKEKTGKMGVDGKALTTDRLRFNSKIPKNALIIFDESHKCKSLDSSTSELLMTAKEQGFKTLQVSASAATNPIEMKALGYATDLHNHYNHNEFKRMFAKAHGVEWRAGKCGGMTFDPTHPDCQAAMKSIHDKLFNVKKCASRLTTEDMKEHFGDNHVIAEMLDMGVNTTKINTAYRMMERELAALDERSSNYSGHIFAVMMKARRQTELLKVPTYVEAIEESIRTGKSAAIFFNFNESIDACVKLLERKYRTPKMIRLGTDLGISTIRGGQTAKARQQCIEDFQSDDARIIVCNIAAGGVGVSLHDLNGDYPRDSFISPNYSPIQLHQALGRIYRANHKTDCVQKILFAAKTIEESACEKVQAKLQNLALLNTGDLADGLTFYTDAVADWDIS